VSVASRTPTLDIDPLLHFSALNFNARRTHDDRTTNTVEHYLNPLLNGPMQALLVDHLLARAA